LSKSLEALVRTVGANGDGPFQIQSIWPSSK
jgi:hypothetical protein